MNLDKISISGCAIDSRKIKPGYLFIALSGCNFNGVDFINDAIKNGAVAIVIDSNIKKTFFNIKIPIIKVENLRNKLADFAFKYFNNPQGNLNLIGVTGTNGKTTCAHIINTVLNLYDINKYACGLIGTLTSELTTPDIVSLTEILAGFVEENKKYIAMEVSSHAVSQNRIQKLDFKVGIFTNLSQDHLDYHKTMDDYWQAKFSFFKNYNFEYIVTNLDNKYGIEIERELKTKAKIFGYSLKHCEIINLNPIKAKVTINNKRYDLISNYTGKFNLSNILACLNVFAALELDLNKIIPMFKDLAPVPGRMQSFIKPHKPQVIVDFAHTPDALGNVLDSLRSICKGRLWCVFGCGGDRDRAKRPLMMEQALKFSDRIIVTQDNPRTENPDNIIQDIMLGLENVDNIIVENDRAKAINIAIEQASEQDIILIAGKGHEAYQIIGEEKRPYSDQEVTLCAL